MAASVQSVPSRPRLVLRPRSVLLARVEALLLRAGSRLDRLDPPVAADLAPTQVLPLRLLAALGNLPRADH